MRKTTSRRSSRKRPYRAVGVEQMDWSKLSQQARGQRLVLGIDVAKATQYGALLAEDEVLVTMKWSALTESREVVRRFSGLPVAELEAAMEPSGVYGDGLRALLWKSGVPVYRVSPKRAHDYTEVYDGVPSTHDGKAAAVVACLHRDGISEPWPVRSPAQREFAAAVATMTLYDAMFDRVRNQLEAQLGRYWPELSELLELGSATHLELLASFGGPLQVARHAARARALMRQTGGSLLKSPKIEAVMASTRHSLGVPMVSGEQEALKILAREGRCLRQCGQRARRRVRALARRHPSVCRMGEAVGLATAAVLVATAGEPELYSCAKRWLKSLGLNLKERSSGIHQGKLKITKRGPALARRYLYLAVLRWIQDEPLAQAWYQAKVQRDGGLSKRALVGLMRKAARALWWVARGASFDPKKLFDVRHLEATGAV